MKFKPVDRLPIVEWASYWDKTVARWHGEGLPQAITDTADIQKYFGLDRFLQLWVQPRAAACPQPQSHGSGILNAESDYDSLRVHLYPNTVFDQRCLEDWSRQQQAGDAVIWFTFEGFFWYPRTLLGIENHLYAFADMPDLIKRMNEDILQFNLGVLDEICNICSPAFMTFAEDMSYNQGPMISKSCFDEFLVPYYRKIVPEIKKRNILTFIDSDGDVIPIIPWFKEIGIEGILPLERMAAVDVAEIRKTHPNFRMIGAFDKTIMHIGEDAIRKEFERLLPVMKQGGFIPSVDHQTPPDVSIENYRLYIRLLKEYCERAAALK